MIGRSFGDYEVIEEIARGAMGVVYKARQISLNRTVALKMVLAGRWAGADLVRRFKAEAEAVAQLDHPNIVPVYEVGEAEGHHYFSMRLMEGGTLAARIPPGGMVDQRHAVTLIMAVAQAIHYAHQRGIIHRDLKPGNILLDAEQRPQVSDFGLAKLLESEAGMTLSGAVMGTPSYMAPEQAAGEAKTLTTAVDVYALGAVLYHLLTGSPPFKESTALGILRKVMQDEPERLSTINRAIDRDLETICLKCLEKDPSRRYSSAEALAEDLDRWVRLEPITARPITTWERMSKWVRRHQGETVLAVVSVVLLMGALVWFLVRVTEERRRAMAAEQETKGALVIAEQNLADAQQAIERFLTRIGSTSLANVPGSGELRVEFLLDAVDYYRLLAERVPEDSSLKLNLATAYSRLCETESERGNGEAAARHGEEARALFRSILDEEPLHPAAQARMLELLQTLAVERLRAGNYEVVLALTAEGQALADNLAPEIKSNPQARAAINALAQVSVTARRWTGETDEALREAEQAAEEQLARVTKKPTDVEALRNLARSFQEIAQLHMNAGRDDEAENAFARALEAVERSRSIIPDIDEATAIHAILLGERASARVIMKRSDEAEQDALISLALLEEVVRRNPTVVKYRRFLSRAYGELGRVKGSRGLLTEALGYQRQGLNVMQGLIEEHPDDRNIRFDLVFAQTLVAEFSGKTGASNDAAAASAAAREGLSRLPDATDRRMLILRARVEAAQGWAARVDGRIDDARTAFDRAIEYQQQLPPERKTLHTLYEYQIAREGGEQPNVESTAALVDVETIINATDTSALLAAVTQVRTVQGNVKQIYKPPSGSTHMINFATDRGAFCAVIYEPDLAQLEKAWGGLHSVLLNRSVRITGQITILRERPQIRITRADQLVILPASEAIADPVEATNVMENVVLNALDGEAIRAAVNRNVVVTGPVFNVMRGGKEDAITFINFDAGRDGFYLVVFADRFDAVAASFGGDLKGALEGKQIRVSGKVEQRRSRFNMIITSPEQLTVLD